MVSIILWFLLFCKKRESRKEGDFNYWLRWRVGMLNFHHDDERSLKSKEEMLVIWGRMRDGHLLQ